MTGLDLLRDLGVLTEWTVCNAAEASGQLMTWIAEMPPLPETLNVCNWSIARPKSVPEAIERMKDMVLTELARAEVQLAHHPQRDMVTEPSLASEEGAHGLEPDAPTEIDHLRAFAVWLVSNPYDCPTTAPAMKALATKVPSWNPRRGR